MLHLLHQLTRGTPLAAEHECVVHGDPGPYNVVVVDGLPVTLIDWDGAHPGPAMEDVGYAGWTWCIQSAGNVPVLDQARHLRAFRDGYDATITADQLLDAIEGAQNLIRQTEQANADDDRLPEWRRHHARTAIAWASSDNELLLENRHTFHEALHDHSRRSE